MSHHINTQSTHAPTRPNFLGFIPDVLLIQKEQVYECLRRFVSFQEIHISWAELFFSLFYLSMKNTKALSKIPLFHYITVFIAN